MVNEYQFDNLPCPVFSPHESSADHDGVFRNALEAIKLEHFADAFRALKPLLEQPPFSRVIQSVLVELVQRILRAEKARGTIARSGRSALGPAAQPFQDLIDRIIYAMAGLSDVEARGLEDRLARML